MTDHVAETRATYDLIAADYAANAVRGWVRRVFCGLAPVDVGTADPARCRCDALLALATVTPAATRGEPSRALLPTRELVAAECAVGVSVAQIS